MRAGRIPLVPLLVWIGAALALAAVAVRFRGSVTPPSLAIGDDLESLTKADLYERARAAGLRGRSQMSKAELIHALREQT